MAQPRRNEDLLDNPVWHALHGPLSAFTTSRSSSDSADHSPVELIQFDPEFSPFGAVQQIDERVWKHVAQLVGVGGYCGFFRDVVPPPPAGWEEQFRGSVLQMLAGDLATLSDHESERLGSDDVADMLELAQLTEPGPFFARTYELGRYVGVRREGRLLAMAGERFRVPGFVEISAVCTHPDAQGEGLGGQVTLNVANSIRAGGDEAFLHVLEFNESAIRLYRKLGFVVRRKLDVVFSVWRGPDWKPAQEEH